MYSRKLKFLATFRAENMLGLKLQDQKQTL